MVAEQVSDPRNSKRSPRFPRNKTVSDSQPALQKTAGPTEGEADWTVVYKDEHEDEIAMKVLISEASTLLSVVATGKA